MKRLRSKDKIPQNDGVRVYQPNNRVATGPIKALATLSTEVAQHRSHIARLFVSDFRAGYRGTVLGVFWNFILPLVPVSVYVLLVNLRVFPAFEGMPPALYIGYNVTVWALFTGMITRPIQVVKARNAETMMTALPMSAAIVSSFAQLCFDTLVRVILVLGLICVYANWPNLAIVDLVLSIFFATLFCFSLGLLLSILNMVFSDIERVVTIILQYGIFLSGVIFPVSSMGPLSVLETTNPLNVIVRSSRDAIFAGGYPYQNELMIWAGVASVVFLVSVNFFYIMEHRIRGVV